MGIVDTVNLLSVFCHEVVVILPAMLFLPDWQLLVLFSEVFLFKQSEEHMLLTFLCFQKVFAYTYYLGFTQSVRYSTQC